MVIADDEPPQQPPRKRGRPKGPPSNWVRISYHITPSLAVRIDAYWHARGLPSRAETVRKLLEHGLGGP